LQEAGRERTLIAVHDPTPLLARGREDLARQIEARLGPFDPLLLEAIRRVPRERFVRADDVDRSNEDIPLPLDDEGLATVSAPHAYCLSYRLLALAPGDSLVELGTGSGYGAALASFIVGRAGSIVTIEIDDTLAALARRLLEPLENVRALRGDAIDSAPLWPTSQGTKIVCTFAIDDLPRAWLAAIPEGGTLVAPVGRGEQVERGEQALVRVARERGALRVTHHGAVRYVKNRGAAPS
jgi:protein-L-isoaspartate(D-aspartate) O-methyltransferase